MDNFEMVNIKKCQQGDLSSFEVLICDYEKRVYNILYRLVGNREDAKDVSQEVFIKLYRKISTFKGNSSFSTWLYTLTVNTGKDFLRKKKENISISEVDNIETKIANRDDNSPEELLEKNERQRIVIQGIEKLKYTQKEIIILRDIQGFSYEEISEILEVTIGTVKSRLNRARLNLKKILTESYNYY